jgi:hypothetical protein
MPTGFDARAYVPRYDAISDVRVRQPGLADGEADRRARRRVAAPDGKPRDPGGRPSRAGEPPDPGRPPVGDLLILGGLVRERGGQSPLDERLLIGCMLV